MHRLNNLRASPKPIKYESAVIPFFIFSSAMFTSSAVNGDEYVESTGRVLHLRTLYSFSNQVWVNWWSGGYWGLLGPSFLISPYMIFC